MDITIRSLSTYVVFSRPIGRCDFGRFDIV